MKISVVMPVHNHERYLPRCLASIDAQDHDELEVVIVDDGSSDGSWHVLSSYPWRTHREVRTVRGPKRGAHAAINRALDLATGDYVAICNSDDYLAPERLSTLLTRVRAAGGRFAFSGVSYVDEDERDVSHELPFACELVRLQREIATFPSVGFAILRSNVAISTGNFFFERSLVEQIGYFRPYRHVHDWDFLLRAVLFTEPVWVAEPLYFYRFHSRNSFLTDKRDGAEETECPPLLRRFMRAAIGGRYPNQLAPSPRNWPVYFEFFIDEYDLRPYLEGWDGADDVVYRPPADDIAAESTGPATLAPAG